MAINDALTQEEVDALFSTEEVEVVAEEKGVQPYDFSSQDSTIRARMPALELVYQRFVKKLDTSMYDLTSCEVEVSMKEIKAMKYADYMAQLPNPTCFNITRMSPLRGTCLFVLDAEFVFILVENFFGGDGRFSTIVENREFTMTEIRIVQILLSIVFRDLQEAWSPIIPIKFEVIKNEMNPQLVNIISGNDIVYVTPFKIGFGQGAGELDIVLPYAMLGTIREKLNMGTQRSEDEIDERWLESLRQEMFFAEVEMNAILTEKMMQLKEIVKLKAGDFIPMDIPEMITGYVENIATYHGKYGISNDKHAFQVTEKIRR